MYGPEDTFRFKSVKFKGKPVPAKYKTHRSGGSSSDIDPVPENNNPANSDPSASRPVTPDADGPAAPIPSRSQTIITGPGPGPRSDPIPLPTPLPTPILGVNSATDSSQWTPTNKTRQRPRPIAKKKK